MDAQERLVQLCIAPENLPDRSRARAPMDKVRAGTAREGGLGHVRRDTFVRRSSSTWLREASRPVLGFAYSRVLGGKAAGVGSYFQDSLVTSLVSLDTRLPASYGPGSNYPPQRPAHAVQIFQKPLTRGYLQRQGCAVPSFRTFMFRMNGTSRLSTWMCDAKPQGGHECVWNSPEAWYCMALAPLQIKNQCPAFKVSLSCRRWGQNSV
jgi:hypothetical protein